MFWHLGTFDKAASLSDTESIAESALIKANFQIFFNSQPGNFIVIGGNDQVVVSVSVAPQGAATYVAVTATSADSPTAEQARNLVRQFIVNG
jgi:hypothetical protein